MSKDSKDLIEIIPFATLLTLAIVRAMPSVTNLMTSMTDIKFQLPYIDIISEDLKKIKKRKTFNLKDNGLDKIRFTEKI